MSERLQPPSHVAIIMDGNRRWAKRWHLPNHIGHRFGARRVESIVKEAAKQNIDYLTLWAYSTDNKKRPKKEKAALMNVFRSYLTGPVMDRLINSGARLKFIGDLSVFEPDIQRAAERNIERSKENKGITVTIGLNYGGRDEMRRGIQSMIRGGIKEPEQVTDEAISKNLDTGKQGIPDPNLIIRTGQRIRGIYHDSGFMPWQSVNSRFYPEKKYWPSFRKRHFRRAIKVFEKSEIRAGA